ncbi:ricin-type beta-trefoil lectin domain protein [Streptomyces sp. NPDC004111]|uniref:RICIN domain-containing protein n=1 Tax=Streptomyces sp. NPDC004111 TaxID=3364690 RepID=UPI0036AD5680
MRFTRGFAGAAAVIGTSVLLVTGTASTANAADVRQYRNVQTGLCLDSSANGSVYTKSCGSTNPFQKWDRTVLNGKIKLRNVGTGRCLTIEDAWTEGLVTEPCDRNDPEQLWWELSIGGKFRMIDDRNYAVDSNTKGNAYLKTYGESNPYQQWYA